VILLPNEFVVEELHKATQSDPFYIVITGDGFRKTPDNRDYDILRDFAKTLTSRFLRIPPFNYCKDYIHVLLALTPSNVRGITDVSSDTAFKLFIKDGKTIEAPDDNFIVNKLKSILFPQHLSVPDELNKSSEDIWFNIVSKSFGAVCIVAYSYEDIVAWNKAAPDPSGLEDSIPFLTYTPEWRFFVLTMKGHFNDENLAEDEHGQQVKLGGEFVHSFSHELSHSLRLVDEYERRLYHPTEPIKDRMKISPNISHIEYTDLDGVDLSGEEILDQVSWSQLMTKSEKDLIKSKDQIWTKKKLDSITIDDKIGELDREIYARKVYSEIPTKSVETHWARAMVVEGGGWFGLELSRSNFECKMRHHIFSDDTGKQGDTDKYKINVDGIDEYSSPAFCRICNFSIRNKITGWNKFGIGIPKRSEFESLFYDELMPRLGLTFHLENIARTLTGPDELRTNGPFCGESASRLYAMLQQKKYDVGFNLSQKHVTLFYKGVYLDPVFYSWYYIDGSFPNARFEFTRRDNSAVSYDFEETKRGFIGDFQQIANYFYGFSPRSNTTAFNILMSRPDLTTWAGKVDYLYNSVYWKGPIKDLTLEDIGLPVSTPVEEFLEDIIIFWSNWLEYWKTRKDDAPKRSYLKPLNMSIKLSDLVDGGN